ncbi:MAG: FHA domain-containing protein [Thermoguttaceae bacterium]|nr:FHA domain-containing protein [Thermoguttaceae bacterium]MDW8080222.1 FHA domain-containing protein [Thermoguttaceae bacterium]
MVRVELVGQNGNTGSRKFIVEKFPVTIGTSREAGVQLTDPEVLPIHCQIEVDGSEIFVRDLAGRPVTFLDGQPVTFARVTPGAKLRVGQSTFIVRPWEPPTSKSPHLSDSATS